MQPPWLIQLSQERSLLRIRQVNDGHTGTLHLPNTNLRLLVRRDGLVLRLTHDGGMTGVVTHAEVPPDRGSIPQAIEKVNHIRGTLQKTIGLGLQIHHHPNTTFVFKRRQKIHQSTKVRYCGGQHFCTEFSMANRNRRDLTNWSMTNLDQDFGQPLGVLQTFELSPVWPVHRSLHDRGMK